MTWMVLATEDELSEQIGLRLANEAGLEIGQFLRQGGSGYLRSRIPSFLQLAQRQPVLLITDLDRMKCPSGMQQRWMGSGPRSKNLLFRVAVREIESWLLADHIAMKRLLGKGAGRLPANPDELGDPKQTLLTLARRASREVRNDLVAREGAIAAQGLGYNARLTQIVRESWQPSRAAERSSSLSRARARLRELASKMENPTR